MSFSNRTVRKVVIPVAGMGTRFLPVTKALPKELLPIIDKPIIHYIVQECVDAGIETVVFVTSRPKILIEDYFDPGDLASHKLADVGKQELIDQALQLSEKIDIVSVRQYVPKGLGHAILTAAPVVEGQDFAVVLGDDIVLGRKKSAIGICKDAFEASERGSVVGVLEVKPEETPSYGVVDFGADKNPAGELVQVKGFVEKPAPGTNPSNWILPGRYIFERTIIDVLRETPPGKNGEIQLTDAMARLHLKSPFFAQKIDGERFDTGDKLGYIIANVAFALKDKNYKEPLRAWLKKNIE
jgi:UTP--glucose-1-phosphate uridylyltransferase